jgi:threonine/homoserine/homoserine lactone efflux protein
LIITPGPDLIYVITRGISLGRKAGIISAFGVIFLLIVGYFSGRLGSFLFAKKSFIDRIRWFTGSILILVGLRIAFLEQK